jgi:hypothetical protein
MAAMGAQAASQIEGNRMMQETVQRGMKGVEDFAARRQLAAARVQLGELKLTDPDYGQKLSGLVMDNPLAFTNEKTAGVANFAFKQAANDFQSKRESEQRTALQAAEFNLRRDLANMETQSRMSLASTSSNADIQAKIFSERFAALDQQRASVLRQMEATKSPVARAILNKQLQGINASSEELSRGFESKASGSDFDSFSSYSGYEPAPLPEDSTQVPTTTGSAGNGPELPTAGEGTMSALDIIPPGIQDGGSFGAPSRIQEVPAAPFTAEAGLPPAPVEGGIPVPPVPAPVVSAAAPVSATTTAAPVPTRTPAYGLTLEDQQLLDTIIAEENLAKAKKTDEGMSASDYKDDEKFTDDLSYTDPDILKVTSELDNLKNKAEALKTVVSSSAIPPTAAQQEQYLVAVSELTKKQTEVDRSKANFRTAVRLAGGPDKYLAIKIEQEKAAREEALKAQSTPAAPAAAAPAAGAGTAAETPKPPPPMSDMAKRFADIETPRKVAEANIVPDTNKQWTNAKNQVVEAVGGMDQLVKITDEVFQDNVFGISLPADVIRLTNAISRKLQGGPEKAIKGFEQKSERSGFEFVGSREIILALVADIIRARGEGVSAAAAAAAKPMPNQNVPAVGNSTVIPKR